MIEIRPGWKEELNELNKAILESKRINLTAYTTRTCEECKKKEAHQKMFFINFILGLKSLWYCEECFTGLCGDSLNDYFTKTKQNWATCSVCEVKEIYAELGKGSAHHMIFCAPCCKRMLGIGEVKSPFKLLAVENQETLQNALRDVQKALEDQDE